MRDRLINDLDSADLFLRNRANSSPAPLNEYDIEEMLDIAKICDEAARTLEKAIIPPCKVGDTLWVRWSYTDAVKKNIYPVKVYALRYDTKKNNMRICVKGQFEITAYGGSYTHYYNGTFAWDSVGKTVFLTREEAEQKLKEGKG